jgi:hypothetical protein
MSTSVRIIAPPRMAIAACAPLPVAAIEPPENESSDPAPVEKTLLAPLPPVVTLLSVMVIDPPPASSTAAFNPYKLLESFY